MEAKPADYIDLASYPRYRSVTDMVPEAIRRLYGQPFTRFQLCQILIKQFNVNSNEENLEETIRKCLYDMYKKGLIEIHEPGSGRGKPNVYKQVQLNGE
jgi:hypothetical protein